MKLICFLILFLFPSSQGDTVQKKQDHPVNPKKEVRTTTSPTQFVVKVSENNEFNKAIAEQMKYEIAIKEEIDTLKPLIADQ